jgi:anhydro-N-acetylmuramic acid kinase
MHTRLAIDHAEMINELLKSWGVSHDEVDCIASHGQTIYHLPARDQNERREKVNSTLQIGDGDHIAAHTGILTISDFRQKHTALGGEGAPLASLVDRLLFSDSSESRIMLNIGGIANLTLLPGSNATNSIPFTTDTGPGNTLIDNAVQAYFNRLFDENGEIAKKGSINRKLLNELLDDSWFDKSTQKSTGPEYFNLDWISDKADDIGSDTGLISPEDLVATVTELSARTISDSIKAHAENLSDTTVYVSGGGARNPVLINRIQEHLGDCQILNVSELGINADAKEAVIFAVLANEMLAGNGFEFETESGPRIGNLGKISFPD